MSDQETKEKRSRSRRRNIMAKLIRDTGDLKGAFSLKVIDGRKSEYKRERINLSSIIEDEEGDSG